MIIDFLILVIAAEPDLDWGTLVRTIGAPAAMMVVALLFAARGQVKFKIDVDRQNQLAAEKYALLELKWSERYADLQDRCKAESGMWETHYAELKEESADRIANLRVEKDMWRDIALKATTTAAEAANKVPPK